MPDDSSGPGGSSGLLRFATAGSVDDGKSTLIGRLLYDSKAIFEDQLAAIDRTSRQRGLEEVDLALLTDGLRAEREQGITIDVAYRYFATPKRKFIIADTPGHLQYTRNMVTGASTADLALVLVDARKGLLEQSRRHACIADLLGIRHLVVCVNKMDLVHWDQAAFDRIRDDFRGFATRLQATNVTVIPISALHGDNVVSQSDWMEWYDGPTVLEHLEEVEILPSDPFATGGARFPVQYVIRPNSDDHHDYRGYAGRVAGGVFRPGDDVVVLPSGLRTTVEAIDTLDGELDAAATGTSVVLRLTDHLDISRGDMICGAASPPVASQDVQAIVCWFERRPLTNGARYAIKHTTRTARAVVRAVENRIDVNTLKTQEAFDGLAMNDIGLVTLRTTVPIVGEAYRDNRTVGSFILIDESTNATAGAGMIVAA